MPSPAVAEAFSALEHVVEISSEPIGNCIPLYIIPTRPRVTLEIRIHDAKALPHNGLYKKKLGLTHAQTRRA